MCILLWSNLFTVSSVVSKVDSFQHRAADVAIYNSLLWNNPNLKTSMAWLSFAKDVLNQAQKTIDKALDIKDDVTNESIGM